MSWCHHTPIARPSPTAQLGAAAEDDESLTAEEKAVMRFQQQRMKDASSNKFALTGGSDDEEGGLTHGGQPLGDVGEDGFGAFLTSCSQSLALTSALFMNVQVLEVGTHLNGLASMLIRHIDSLCMQLNAIVGEGQWLISQGRLL